MQVWPLLRKDVLRAFRNAVKPIVPRRAFGSVRDGQLDEVAGHWLEVVVHRVSGSVVVVARDLE